MKKLTFLAITLPLTCFALEEKPWYGNLCEFNFRTGYEYNFFNKVDNATPQLNRRFNTHVLDWSLGVTVPPTWNWEMELELADTTDVSWGYRSFAFQIRKLWFDDICGDPSSLSTGIVYRDASNRMRRALSTPYHARANFEFQTSFGKEWSCGPSWVFRTYGVAAVGQGTQGSPWLRGDLFLWYNYEDCHQVRLFARSYFGLGNEETVFLNNFDGWGDIRHQSIDIGASYRYFFSIYANLRFDYLYRVYARSYPERVNFFIFTLQVPFSIF